MAMWEQLPAAAWADDCMLDVLGDLLTKLERLHLSEQQSASADAGDGADAESG